MIERTAQVLILLSQELSFHAKEIEILAKNLSCNATLEISRHSSEIKQIQNTIDQTISAFRFDETPEKIEIMRERLIKYCKNYIADFENKHGKFPHSHLKDFMQNEFKFYVRCFVFKNKSLFPETIWTGWEKDLEFVRICENCYTEDKFHTEILFDKAEKFLASEE